MTVSVILHSCNQRNLHFVVRFTNARRYLPYFMCEFYQKSTQNSRPSLILRMTKKPQKIRFFEGFACCAYFAVGICIILLCSQKNHNFVNVSFSENKQNADLVQRRSNGAFAISTQNADSVFYEISPSRSNCRCCSAPLTIR